MSRAMRRRLTRDLWLGLNHEFRPVALDIRGGPGEAGRLAARIGPQTQREQVGETKGSVDVKPVVEFKSDTDRKCRRCKAL